MIEDLKQLGLEGDISSDRDDLKTHSRDASVFIVNPTVIVYPKSVEDVQKVVKLANEKNFIVSVRAGGTCMSGGSLTTGIILNMTRYMSHISVNPETKTAEVEMGAMYRDLESQSLKHNLVLGSYTSSKDICGVGGMIGNNASGEKSVRHGATIDQVLGLEVVLADGTIIRTGEMEQTSVGSLTKLKLLEHEVKPIYDSVINDLKFAIGEVPKVASGYRLERVMKSDGSIDLTKLFVGAQGTLGIVTKAILKLVPLPAFTRLLVISVDSFEELPYILETVMKHNPEGVETFDRNTFNRAKNLLEHETAVSQQFFDPQTGLVVLAQFSQNTQEETDAVAYDCEQGLKKHPVKVTFVTDKDLQDSIWKIRRSSFSVMRDYNKPGHHAVPCIEDIIVPIKNFNVLVPELKKLLDVYNIEYGFHGHIGDGSLRIIPIFDFNKTETVETIISFTKEAIALVKKLRGNMSADHSDGIIRTPFVRDFYGEKVYEAFARIKLLLDPKGTLNRGKKIGGTEEMIRKYIVR